MSQFRKALILGVTGQDGSYLAEFLLRLGYEVHGVVRRTSSFNTTRIDYLGASPWARSLILHHSDLTDFSSLAGLISSIQPSEVYNLAAQSHVRTSFDLPLLTSQVTGIGTLNVLESVRLSSLDTRVYQASSSEMFGAAEPPQSELTSFYPRSPYGVSKVYAYWIARNYREAYGMHISNGILFNHESPRRTPTFLTRKVTRGVARIRAGIDSTITLGNLSARRDWGYAPEYVAGMWLMLQQDSPDDYVLATGTSTSVQEWVDLAFDLGGLNPKEFVKHNPRFLRPTEVDNLIGDPAKARNKLGWSHKVRPEQLAAIMLTHDERLIKEPELVDSVEKAAWQNYFD